MKNQRKYSSRVQASGFTLIELLVAIVLAFLVLTPLFGFVFNIIDADRKEQAKATSDQEIQSALDYISQDLEQAVYIYDSSGLDNNSTTDPSTSGIKDQIPPVATPVAAIPGCQSTTTTSCVPVLVFWKREPIPRIIPVADNNNKKDGTFVYSLVAYYLVKGNNSGENWSNTARIARFQIQDGVINPTDPTNTNGTPKYIKDIDSGFQLFDLSLTGTTLKEKMNRWQKASANYSTNTKTLVDFVDQSTSGITPNCPSNTRQVPSTLSGAFYACVDSSRTVAQVYIRGNALARLGNNTTYNDSLSGYFPTVSTQIKGRGVLGFD